MKKLKKDKHLLSFLLVAVLLLCTTPITFGAIGVQAEFYIDPTNGSDYNNGSKTAPFATIEKAQEAVRREVKNMSGDIYVWFADGRYELEKPITFDASLGGRKDYKVYYQAIKGAKPEISGGREVKDWELYDKEKNIYRAKTGGLYSRDFVVDGIRMTRARTAGYLSDVQLDYGIEGFTCSNVEMYDYKNKSDMECVFINKFHQRRIMVDHMKMMPDGTVKFILNEYYWDIPTGGRSGYVVPDFVENAYELIDTGGEWYINRRDGYVYYKPLEGQDMEKVHAVIPVLEKLVDIGGYDYYAKAKNMVFKGLTFTDTTWMQVTEDGGYTSAQDGYQLQEGSGQDGYILINDSAVTIIKAENISIEDCTFKALGAAGIRILEGSQKINFVGNHMYNLGSGAMHIGSARHNEMHPKDERRWVQDIYVANNYIHHVSDSYVINAGVSIGYPKNLHFVHNEIHDTSYSGLHVGWGWQNTSQKNLQGLVVAENYIHDFMKGWSTIDGGGIYCLGYTADVNRENPLQIVRNYFKDDYAGSAQAGGMIYLDNTSSHYLVENNVLDNIEGSKVCDASPFAQTTYTPLNNYWHENFTTTLVKHKNNVLNEIIFEDNEHYPTANWPEKARKVINNAGLEPAYRHLSPRPTEYARLFTVGNLVMVENQTYQIKPIPSTEFCDELSLDDTVVTYESVNPEIAKVSESGVITAHKNGQTKIITKLTYEGVTCEATTFLSVGTGLGSVQIVSGLPNKIVKGETKQLPEVRGFAYSGSEVDGDITNITYKSADENILDVDLDTKTITAKDYGQTVLTVGGEFEGEYKETEYVINVIDYADQSGINYETIDTTEIMADTESWYTNSGLVNEVAGGMAFDQSDIAMYLAKTYGDGLFDIHMMLEKQAMWPSLTIRNQMPAEGFTENNSMYIVCFAKSGIELQRYNGETRTSIFCNLLPDQRIGPTHPMILQAGKKYHIQFGAFNEDGGVRIILNIDGVNVMNYLDETEGRIEGDGYFGLRVNTTKMHVTSE